MCQACEKASQQAARLAALESFRVYGRAIQVSVAWVSITAALYHNDPFTFEQLPTVMSRAFCDEYARVCKELSAEAA